MLQWGLDTPFSALLYFFPLSPESHCQIWLEKEAGLLVKWRITLVYIVGHFYKALLRLLLEFVHSFLAIGQTSVFYHKMKSFFIK